MSSALEQLKDRIFKRKTRANKNNTGLIDILYMIKELGCFSDIIGRDFEVKDPKGKLVYTIRQKPISIKQLNVLMKTLPGLKKMYDEWEAAKWGKPKRGGRRPPRRR